MNNETSLRALAISAVVGINSSGVLAQGHAFDNQELVQFLIDQNSSSLKTLTSIECEYRWRHERYVSLRGSFISFGTGSILEEGELLATDFEYTFKSDVFPHTGNVQRFTRQTELYVAHWTGRGNPVLVYLNPPSGTPDAKHLAARNLDRGIEPFLYGYGNGTATLAEHYRHTSLDRSISWHAHEQQSDEGMPRFVLELHTAITDPFGVPTFRFVLDPSQGFLIVRAEAFGLDGELGVVVTVQPAQDERTGAWYPSIIDELVLSEWQTHRTDRESLRGSARLDENGNSIVRHKHVEISHISINEDISDERFSVKTMPLANGKHVSFQSHDGSHYPKVFHDGLLLTQDELLRVYAETDNAQTSPDRPATPGERSKGNLLIHESAPQDDPAARAYSPPVLHANAPTTTIRDSSVNDDHAYGETTNGSPLLFVVVCTTFGATLILYSIFVISQPRARPNRSQ